MADANDLYEHPYPSPELAAEHPFVPYAPEPVAEPEELVVRRVP